MTSILVMIFENQLGLKKKKTCWFVERQKQTERGRGRLAERRERNRE